MSRRFLRVCCGWIVGVFLLIAVIAPFPHDLCWGVLATLTVALWSHLDGRVSE